MRIDSLDDFAVEFAVEFENQPQDAVRGWMLWTKIDREIADWIVAHVKSVSRRSSLRLVLSRFGWSTRDGRAEGDRDAA
jgi:hypothetical protein